MEKNFQRIKNKLDFFVWEYIIKTYHKLRYPQLMKSTLSVISCNCIGGVVCSEFNMPFNSPTVNCFMSASDFLQFSENLALYLTVVPTDAGKSTEGYPLVLLDDLMIHAVHYKKYEDFCTVWERRKLRFNHNNIFAIFTDRDGFVPEMLPRIAKLPFPKVLFSSTPYENFDFVCVVPQYRDFKNVESMMAFQVHKLGCRVYHIFPWGNIFCRLSSVAVSAK